MRSLCFGEAKSFPEALSDATLIYGFIFSFVLLTDQVIFLPFWVEFVVPENDIFFRVQRTRRVIQEEIN